MYILFNLAQPSSLIILCKKQARSIRIKSKHRYWKKVFFFFFWVRNRYTHILELISVL